MSDQVFIIRNQLGQFWIRAGEWVDGREPQRILKLRHRDEAVNLLVELSAKDIDLRGEVIESDLDHRGEPEVEVSAHATPTLAEKAAAQALLAEAAANEDNNPEDSAGEAAETTASADEDPAMEPSASAGV